MLYNETMPSPSINLIKSSDGTGNAAMATVQSTRAPGASTIIVDTVDNIPATFYGAMGTPHTFVDPITAETITVISEATSRDFEGHVDGTNLEIDAMAPGNTDLGSTAGDVIIIKPTTEWANNIAITFAVAHNDDGSLKAVVSNQGWTDVTGTTVTATTANGNRSYDLTVDQDLRTVLSPGMRLRTTRTVAAPTQCTSLNGTTQYYSKTTPAGMTFTDNFTAMGWVKLSSYANGYIISRYNGTTGWGLNINASGQVRLQAIGTAGAEDNVLSYQSVPLNKWVHIAASISMAGTSGSIYIDGVLVPSAYTNGAASALIQAGNLEVGTINGAAFFPGKIAQAAVSSTVISAANIKTLYSQGLTPALITANSIISAYSFDNAITDLNTTTANNLTANGAPSYAVADSPFGGQADGTISSTLDHAIIQKVTASTITVQVAEGCTIPTSGGVSSLSYATVKSPYGFPGQKTKWRVESIVKVRYTQTSPVTGTWYNLSTTNSVNMGAMITLPIGEYNFGYEIPIYIDRAAAGGLDVYVTLSTANNTESDKELTGFCSSSGGSAHSSTLHREKQMTITSATPYYMNLKSGQASALNLLMLGDLVPSKVYIDNAYL